MYGDAPDPEAPELGGLVIAPGELDDAGRLNAEGWGGVKAHVWLYCGKDHDHDGPGFDAVGGDPAALGIDEDPVAPPV